jgi:hypothetical protein
LFHCYWFFTSMLNPFTKLSIYTLSFNRKWNTSYSCSFWPPVDRIGKRQTYYISHN